MPAWSSLRGVLRQAFAPQSKYIGQDMSKRMMSEHKTMVITASRWQWRKFKDLVHLYFLVGIIPVSALIFYTNVFIGPAKLTPIPEGYTPKHYEYYRHPITRFLARYIFTTPQQEYEKYMDLLYEKDEIMKIARLQRDVLAKMSERNDYQAFYFRPVTGKYARQTREDQDYIKMTVGIENEKP